MPRLRRKVFLKLSPLSLLRRGGSSAQGVRQAQRRASRGGTKAHALRPEPATSTVDPSALTVGTNVGTTLKKDDSGRFDCTIRMSDSIQLILRGTDAAATWSSEDTSVVTVSADGKLKPVKAGTANVTASVGGTTVRCVVRINN